MGAFIAILEVSTQEVAFYDVEDSALQIVSRSPQRLTKSLRSPLSFGTSIGFGFLAGGLGFKLLHVDRDPIGDSRHNESHDGGNENRYEGSTHSRWRCSLHK